MTRKKKATYRLNAVKNQQPQGAWLAYYLIDLPTDDGFPPEVVEYAAFTTAAAAKRHLAAKAGRSRLTWTDVNGDGLTLTAAVEVSVDA